MRSSLQASLSIVDRETSTKGTIAISSSSLAERGETPIEGRRGVFEQHACDFGDAFSRRTS
jgi:hypothetical protein